MTEFHREKPLVSVIVPIYGIEQYIGICIESIINQIYKNLEIILVDDGSLDRCSEICDLYAKKDSRIKVIHKENGGLVSARKAGLTASTGNFVGYVDGDDWIGPGFYESLITLMLVSNADVVAAGQRRDLFTKSEQFYNVIAPGLYEGERLEELRRQMISHGQFYRPGITTYVWNKLFRRDVLLEHQLRVKDGITIGEDGAVSYPVLMNAERVYVADNCAYHYRQREDSMLKKSVSFQQEKPRLRLLYEYLLDFSNRYPAQYELQRQVTDYLLGICIMRSGSVLPVSNAKDFYSLFGTDFRGKKVVVYSADTFGQQLVNRINENHWCSVVGWIDDDYWEYRRCCLDVDPISSVASIDYNYVLVATVDGIWAQHIKTKLTDYGISPEKILIVNCPEKGRKSLLQQYLYD